MKQRAKRSKLKKIKEIEENKICITLEFIGYNGGQYLMYLIQAYAVCARNLLTHKMSHFNGA